MVAEKIIYLVIIVVLLLSSDSLAQAPGFTNIREEEVLNTDAEEVMPVISPDGSVLYFSRVFSDENTGGDFAGSDIWIANRTTNGWEAPFRGPNSVNNRDNNAVIGVNSNGNIVYLLNAYRKGEGITYVEGTSEGWTRPDLIPVQNLESQGFVGVFVSPDYQVMLLSMERAGGRGKEDLYICLRDSVSGGWKNPISLGSTINTRGFEISPFLSEDKKFLFFASDGHGGLGDADIFMSRRLYDRWDVWSAPINLGEGINSPYFDAYYTMTGDSTVYFASNRKGGLSDIYQAKIEAVKKSEGNLDAKKIIAEAQAILNELRESNVKDEELLIFEPGDRELNERSRAGLRELINRLKYKDYSSFHLLTVDPEGSLESDVQKARIEEVKRFISIMGVGGKNIFDYPAAQEVTLKDGSVFNEAEGILIIVKD